MKRSPTLAAIATVTLVGALTSASPAAATDGNSSDTLSVFIHAPSQTGYIKNTKNTQSISETASNVLKITDEISPNAPLLYEKNLEASDAPAMISSADASNIDDITSVKESTFQALWDPGSVIPSDVSAVSEGKHVEMLMLEPEDRSSLMVLLVIDSAEAATEYQFKGAVPPGYSAELQLDGSVRFLDSDGNEAGGIMKPWAHDSNGTEVSTSYRLDGDTLIQTIKHQDAAHPVIADPWWVPVIVVAIKVAVTIQRTSTTAKVVVGACAGHPGCRSIVKAVVDHGYRAGSTIYNTVRNYHGKSKNKSQKSCTPTVPRVKCSKS